MSQSKVRKCIVHSVERTLKDKLGLEKVSLNRGFPLVKITYGKVTLVDIQVTVLLKNVSCEVVTLPKG